MTSTPCCQAILTNLTVLHARLAESSCVTADACTAAREGNRNGAIGVILGLEQTLKECETLYRMILLLHRAEVRETGQ